MKQINIFFCIVLLINAPLTTIAQWLPSSTGNPAGVTHCFIESSGILLAGGNAGIYASIDNGDTWTPSNNGISSGNEILSFVKNSAGIFAASDTIYFSNNNGASWTIVNSNSKSIWAFALLGDTVFAASLSGGVIMTANNGTTWQTVSTGLPPTEPIYYIVSKQNLLFVSTFNSGIFMSSNSGASWSPVNSSLPFSIATSLATDGTSLFAGTSNGFYVSSNNGASWSLLSVDNKWTVRFVDNAMLAQSPAHVVRSLDGGVIWTSFIDYIEISCPYGLDDFYATTQYVFCGVEGSCAGSIYRVTKNEVLLSFEEKGEKFSYSVFPIPANQKTITLLFNNPTLDNFTLTIFDTRGIFIQELSTRTIDKFEIDGQNLKSGVYYFRLQSDRQIANGKFVLN